jgi:hypothetical protein
MLSLHLFPSLRDVALGAFVMAAVTVIALVVGLILFGDKHLTYYVSPKGDDVHEGLVSGEPLRTIQRALQLAKPGDKIQLADGEYYQSFRTASSGRPGAPITITGSQNAVVRGETSNNRIIEINHDYITLKGFKVDGWDGQGATRDDFRDKLIYAIGTQPQKGVNGLVITQMTIQNDGGECVRLRYMAQDNEVSHSTVRHCGIYDFRFKEGGKNGEGIYIGTAPEQRRDGRNPTADVDRSKRNHIHHNLIETYGNECVDVKEGASDNLVEHNTCRHQQDPESGGMDARGNANTFRFNIIEQNVGAGVRLGGDEEDDGTHNNVYENTIKNNQRGALRVVRFPQGAICGNTMNGNGDEDAELNAATPCG